MSNALLYYLRFDRYLPLECVLLCLLAQRLTNSNLQWGEVKKKTQLVLCVYPTHINHMGQNVIISHPKRLLVPSKCLIVRCRLIGILWLETRFSRHRHFLCPLLFSLLPLTIIIRLLEAISRTKSSSRWC